MSNGDDRIARVVSRTRQSVASNVLGLEDRLLVMHWSFDYVEPTEAQTGLWDQDLGTSLRGWIWVWTELHVVVDGNDHEKTRRETGE